MTKENAGISERLSTRERDSVGHDSLLEIVRIFRLSRLSLILLTSLAAALPSSASTPKEAALHTTGLRTIQAIAGGDAAYIASIADPKGIYVGYDKIRHPVDSFKNDLAHNVGLYCELFEKNCKTNHNPSYSLGHVLSSGAKPTNSDLKFKINGNVGTLECWEFGGAGDLIVTFSYRFADGKWYLYNIYYV
jgi:hypothetical protein